MHRQAAADLAELLARVRGRLPAADRALLDSAQQHWEQVRQATCRVFSASAGRYKASQEASCRTIHAQTRYEELQALFEPDPGEDP